MAKRQYAKKHCFSLRRGMSPLAAVLALALVWTMPGCFDPVYPQLDREARIMDALERRDNRTLPAGPLTADEAVVYALANNLDNRVAEIEAAYQSESLVASRRRLLPGLTARYSMEHANHPAARWSKSTKSGNQSLETSYSADPNLRQGEIGVMWNLIDFGVGYLRSRQQGERVRYAELQRRRVRQQVVLDVLTYYWRAAAAQDIARQAEELRRDLDEQAESIRDSVEMRIISGAEGARRELAVHGSLAELEQWRRNAVQTRLELARVMGCGSATEFTLADFPAEPPRLPARIEADPDVLQTAALKRRPELYQYDAQERIAVDEARVALLQMAPTANLSLSLHNDPDKFLEWSDWMTVGVRATWNLFNIPARLSERRMAKLQGEVAKQKGLALAAAVMAQVGIAYSDWRLSHSYAQILHTRAAARERLVEALAAGERDNQTRPGEVLQERVRLLSEQAAAMRATAETRIAGARLANAIGIEANDLGQFVWDFKADANGENYEKYERDGKSAILYAESKAAEIFPNNLAGIKVVKADVFYTPDEYFETPPRATAPEPAPKAEPGSTDGKKPVRNVKRGGKSKAPTKSTICDKGVKDNVDADGGANPSPANDGKAGAAADSAGNGPRTGTGAKPENGDPVKTVSRDDADNPAKSQGRAWPKITSARKRAVAEPPGVVDADVSENAGNSLPEELQALRPSADSFGDVKLPRNEFVDMRRSAEPKAPILNEPASPMVVPAGALRPGEAVPEAGERRMRPNDERMERLYAPNESFSLRPPGQESVAPDSVPDGASWEERRLRALEPLPSLDIPQSSLRPDSGEAGDTLFAAPLAKE